MTQTHASLFIGGPVNGQLTAVRQDPFFVPVAYPADPIMRYGGDITDPKPEPEVETVMYSRRVIQLLGHDLVIYLDPTINMHTPRGVRTVLAAILTPNAQGAVRPLVDHH